MSTASRKIAIEVQNASLVSALRVTKLGALRKSGFSFTSSERVTRFRDVSFRIDAGERVGLLGRNGAGKSSVISCLVGTERLTEGSMRTVPDIRLFSSSSLLSKKLSVYENLELALLAAGVKPVNSEVVSSRLEKFGLDGFYERPVFALSSGMKARLKLAMSLSGRPSVLVIDEGLAAGDARFRESAAGQLESHFGLVGTLLLVSHSENVLRTFCDRGLVMEAGELRFDGSIAEAIEFYNS